jgi:ABC-type branched-subunit amino acid transport system substrate-binding protein
LAAALQADGKVQVVFNKYHDYQATDFTADLANVKASGANLFWSSTVSSNVMTMIKQAYSIGLSKQAVMMTVADGFYYTSEYATTVGTAGDNVIITSFHKPGTNYTSLTPSMDAYYSKLGYGPQVTYYITMQVFEDVLLIANAANKAGSTNTQSMVKALETNTFTGPWGAITFPTTANGYHQWTPSMLFEQYQSLTLKIIYPTAVAEAQMILPSG